MNRLFFSTLAVGLSLSLAAKDVCAQFSGTWNVDASGTFATATNWLNGIVPSSGGTATFGPVITAPRTVTVASTVSLGGLAFNDSDGYTVTSTGSATLTLLPGITGAPAPINVVVGTDLIAAPIAGTTSINKIGAGTLVLSGNNTFVGDTQVNAGVLRLTASSALGPAATTNAVGVSGGGRLELAGPLSLGTRDLILATSTSQAPDGAIRATTGSSSLNGSVFLVQSTSIGVDAGATLSLGGELIDNGNSGANILTKAGSGALIVKRFGGGAFRPGGSPQPIGSLNIASGSASVAPNGTAAATSRVGTLIIGGSATLDLADNALVIDYAGSSPANSIRTALFNGQLFASGVGALRIGYAEASTLGLSVFAGQPTDTTSLVMQAVLPGDADLNGSVDFNDLLALAKSYGGPGEWSDGDFDYSGEVDFNDLLVLAREYGAVAGADPMTRTLRGPDRTGMTISLRGSGNSSEIQNAVFMAVYDGGLVPEPVFGDLCVLVMGTLSARVRKSCASR